MSDFYFFQLNDPFLKQIFLYCKTISISSLKNALSDKCEPTVGEGRSELIPGNAKHLCAENQLRRFNFFHISMGIWEEAHREETLWNKRDNILQKGLKVFRRNSPKEVIFYKSIFEEKLTRWYQFTQKFGRKWT